MSMQLTLAKIDAALLDVIRAEPLLLDRILGGDIPAATTGPLPGGAVLTAEDRFSVDYRTLDAIAAPWRTGRGSTGRPAGRHRRLRHELRAGVRREPGPRAWRSPPGSPPRDGRPASGESSGTSARVDSTPASTRSARALGEAAEWDPDEIERTVHDGGDRHRRSST
jgi:hypothetical protein